MKTELICHDASVFPLHILDKDKVDDYCHLDTIQIVSQAKPYVPMVGIYFLCQDERVVYVGQSVDVMARLSSHARPATTKEHGEHIKLTKEMTVLYIAVPKEYLDVVERLYIMKLRPPLNIKHYTGSVRHPLTDTDKILLRQRVRSARLVKTRHEINSHIYPIPTPQELPSITTA